MTRTHPYMKANKDPLNKEIIGRKEKSLAGRKTHNLFPVFWVFLAELVGETNCMPTPSPTLFFDAAFESSP